MNENQGHFVTGCFVCQRRHAENWEVTYKSFNPFFYVGIASGMAKNDALELKDNLNRELDEFRPPRREELTNG